MKINSEGWWPPRLVARTVLAAALTAVAIWTGVITFFDPFGVRGEQAQQASRQTTALVLCAVVAVQDQRASVFGDSGREEEAAEAARAARELRDLSERVLGIRCGGGRTARPVGPLP